MQRSKIARLAALIFLCGSAASLAAPPRTPLAFERDDSIEVLRAKIAHNGCSFKVGRNWVYDLPPEQRDAMRGRRTSSFAAAISDEIGPLEKHLSKTLPAAFDWRNYNGHSYIGPIRDQGACGSCYAFGAAAAAEGTYNFALGLYDGACVDFSEAFIAGCLGSLPAYNPHFYGCDGADYDYQELQALTVEGICYESAYPYSPSAAQTCPSTTWSAPRAVFASWHRVPCGDIEAIKTAIMTYGVVDVAVQTTRAWDGYAGGIYSDSNTSCTESPCYDETTDHAVSLVGWDDTPPEGGGGVWILRNSWGQGWGESGYMRICYTSAAVSCAVCYLVYSEGPIPTPVPAATPTPTPTPIPTATPPIDLTAQKVDFSSSGRIDVWGDVWPISTPCYPFIRIVMADGSTLYYERGKGFMGSPTPYLGFAACASTVSSPILGYPALQANFSGIAAGTYILEGGAVDAAKTTSANDLVYFGTVDREVLTVR